MIQLSNKELFISRLNEGGLYLHKTALTFLLIKFILVGTITPVGDAGGFHLTTKELPIAYHYTEALRFSRMTNRCLCQNR